MAASPLTDRQQRAVMVAAWAAIGAGAFAVVELVYVAVRWLTRG